MEITPQTKVAELLDAFPQLEEKLISLSPAFKKLNNPILRSTIAKVTSLEQAASMVGIRTDDLILQLKSLLGITDADDKAKIEARESEYLLDEGSLPDWYNKGVITGRFDATAALDKGDNPLRSVNDLARELENGGILEIRSLFVPVPMLEILKGKGFEVFSIKRGEDIFSYIRRKS